jgi:error-prone DNA polymerase
MTCRADTLGVFQIESRAQMSMLPRLKPEVFYDLVIQVAIVRPGPIQGNMVHPYLRRRENPKEVAYPSEKLEEVLKGTLGIPLFQEQAMKIAIIGAGFTPAEADKLRRAMATFRNEGTISSFRDKFITGMLDNEYPPEFAQNCFKQIEGFGSYGFPESHAAAFASLAYVTAWLKCRYPDAFAAGLLNSLPMGFYAPAQIVRDAQEHGIEVRPIDVLHSEWDCTLEDGPDPNERLHARHAAMQGAMWGSRAIRLGMRQVKGLSQDDAEALAACRPLRCRTIEELWRWSGVSSGAIELLAEADAFRAMGYTRRQALWEARALSGRFAGEDAPQTEAVLQLFEPEVTLPAQTRGEAVVDDYRRTSLSLKDHPMSFLRSDFAREGVVPAERLADLKNGARVTVGGVVLVRQMPGTAGVVFVTLEDETGIANIIVWPKLFQKFRPEVIGARCLAVTGRLQKAHGVMHVIAYEIENRSWMLNTLGERGGEISPLANADEVRRPQGPRFKTRLHPGATLPPRSGHPGDRQAGLFVDADVIPKGRSFH